MADIVKNVVASMKLLTSQQHIQMEIYVYYYVAENYLSEDLGQFIPEKLSVNSMNNLCPGDAI